MSFLPKNNLSNTLIINSQNLSDKISNKKIDRASNYFWFGFTIYTLSYSLSSTSLFNYVICNVFQTIGLILLIPNVIPLIRFKIENNYLKFIFYFYIIWLLSVIGRGFTFEYEFLKKMLFDPSYGVFLYASPLILLFPINIHSLNKLFNVITIFGIIYIASDIVFIKYLLNSDFSDLTGAGMVENFTISLSISSGFILLTNLYHSNKRKLLALIVMILSLIFSIVRARRGLTFHITGILFCSYIFFYYINKGKLLNKYFALVMIPVLFYFGARIYSENKTGLFGLITERLVEDTRTGVEVSFYQDMSMEDWVIGKGINGSYYCPGIDEGEDNDFRYVIETGYLHIILKGGIISLVLLLFIAIPAIIKGLFFSKNLLSKAAAIWILLYILNLYPAQNQSFTLYYFLVWISISFCYSTEIRNLPDSNIINLLTSFRKRKDVSNYISFRN